MTRQPAEQFPIRNGVDLLLRVEGRPSIEQLKMRERALGLELDQKSGQPDQDREVRGLT